VDRCRHEDDAARRVHARRAGPLAARPGPASVPLQARTSAEDQGFHGRNGPCDAGRFATTMDERSARSHDDSAAGSPTVVLVHGAFADGSSWNGVIQRLQAKGVKVMAPANPLRGIPIDSAYIAGVFEQTPGPVLAVGHSYGGAVITNAASDAKNVIGLIYVAAFAPEEGEALADAAAESKDSVLMSALVPRHYPAANGGDPGVEFAIIPRGCATRSRLTYRSSRQHFWLPPSGRCRSWRSRNRRARRPGGVCGPGPSSQPVTERPAPT